MSCISFFPYSGEVLLGAKTKTVTVKAGETIKAGSYVIYVSGSTTQVQNPVPGTTTSYNGIAQTGGSGGQQIKIYVPNV